MGAGGLRKGREPGSQFLASASCLGRHGRPADRRPNGSSLFLPLGGGRRRCPPDFSAGRCCSNPPLGALCKVLDKTETPASRRRWSFWWARVDHAEPHKGREPGSRFPASASCLGRHGRPADRSPNGSSLFPPLGGGRRRCPLDFSAGRCCSKPPLGALCKVLDKIETPASQGRWSSWWARVDCASRAAKNSPLGCFYAVFSDVAAAVRIHPPALLKAGG